MDLPAFALFLVFTFASAAMAQKAESDVPSKSQIAREERLIQVAQFRGQFMGFEFGDYLHATFMERTGKKKSFYLKFQGIDYFLTQHKGRDIQVTYEVVDQFVPEANGLVRLERIRDIKAGSQRYSVWWKNLQNKMTPEEIRKRFEPLVEKAML